MIEPVTEETIQRALRLGFELRLSPSEFYDACVLESPKGDESRGWCCEWRPLMTNDGRLIFYPSWLPTRLKELEEENETT